MASAGRSNEAATALDGDEYQSLVDVVVKASELKDDENKSEIVMKMRALLVDEKAVSVFLHIIQASSLLKNNAFVQIFKTLNIDPNSIAQYLPNANESAGVGNTVIDPVLIRRQYQKVIGAHTRIQVYDLFTENVVAYSSLASIFSSQMSPDEMWCSAIKLIGRYDLEPFRALSMYLDACEIASRYPSHPHKEEDKTSGGKFETLHSLENYLLNTPFCNRNLLAFFLSAKVKESKSNFYVHVTIRLVLSGVITLDDVNTYLCPEETQFSEYLDDWKKNSLVSNSATANSLSSSLTLGDSDDEDEQLLDADGNPQQETEAEKAIREAKIKQREDEAARKIRLAEIAAQKKRRNISAVSKYQIFIGTLLGQTVEKMNISEGSDLELYNVISQKALELFRRHSFILAISKSICHGVGEIAVYNIKLLRKQKAAGENYDKDRLNKIFSNFIIPICHQLSKSTWRFVANFLSELQDKEYALYLFRIALLPSLDLQGSVSDVEFVQDLNRPTRYALYYDLQSRLATGNIMVKARYQKSEKETRDILKRLTRTDVESIVPRLVSIIGDCPLPALSVFVNQVESYNIGKILAKANVPLTDLSLDVLPLVIMQRLTLDGKIAQKSDGLHENKWIRLLADFVGDMSAAYKKLDFVAIIDLILAEFYNNDYSQLVVLDAIISSLSGIPKQNSLSVPQIMSINSQKPLSTCARMDISGHMYPHVTRLLDSLKEANLIQEIIAALLYAYSDTLKSKDDSKITFKRLDSIASLLIVYCTLINSSGVAEEMKFVINHLIDDLNVPLEFAFAICRYSSGIENIREYIPEPCASFQELYESFWSYNLYDIKCNGELYVLDTKRSPDADLLSKSESNAFSDAEKKTSVFEKAALQHKLRNKSVIQKLQSSKHLWFANKDIDYTQVVSHMLIPRIVLSPSDGIYTSNFLQTLLELNVPLLDFHSLVYAIFSRPVLLYLLSTSTPNEIESFSMFLYDFTGFLICSDKIDDKHTLIRTIHKTITLAVLEMADTSASYTILSNILSLLQQVIYAFPMFTSDGKQLLKRVQILSLSLNDNDLLTASKSLFPQLSQKSNSWIDEGTKTFSNSEFHKNLINQNNRLTSRLKASLSLRVNGMSIQYFMTDAPVSQNVVPIRNDSRHERTKNKDRESKAQDTRLKDMRTRDARGKDRRDSRPKASSAANQHDKPNSKFSSPVDNPPPSSTDKKTDNASSSSASSHSRAVKTGKATSTPAQSKNDNPSQSGGSAGSSTAADYRRKESKFVDHRDLDRESKKRKWHRRR